MKFFDQPILNSPYELPLRHWELDEDGRPRDAIVARRRKTELNSPIPGPRRTAGRQARMVFDTGHGLSSDEQECNPSPVINELRGEIERWRALPSPEQWQVTR